MMILDSSLDLISALIRDWFTLNPAEPFKSGVKVASIVGTVVTVVTTLTTKTVPWFAAKLKAGSVSKRLGPEFTIAGIQRSIRYYIRAWCQDLDPAGGEEPRLVFGVQQKLFEALDKALTHPTEYNFVILLADSGMGKTSALINYYARHLRRFRKPFNLFLIPLGIPDADERIAAIKDRAGTVLFLDALDEDTLAIVDHAERLRTLLESTRDFERVLISCRTQFFSKDEEIPRETGKIKVSSRAAGEAAEYYFHKIYLSPFNDDQVSKYLKRRYPIWRLKRRRKAQEIVRKIPNLTVRPMLLAHVDDIVQSNRKIEYSYQLYEEMVGAWLTREQGFIQQRDDLLQFSERLAVDIYLNRAERGSERIQREQLVALAREWGIPLEDWKLSGRSLLNRDAEGNYKFAHRSIMEYLFVQRFLQGEMACLAVEWTDQMVDFYMEILEHDFERGVKLVLPALTTRAEANPLVEQGELLGRRFFTMILKEITSTNLQRWDQALRALGGLCFEMLNPTKRTGIVVTIKIFDEELRPQFKHIVHVYAAIQDGVHEIVIDSSGLSLSNAYDRPSYLDRFPPTIIELNGEFLGTLLVSCRENARASVLDKSWVFVRDFLSGTLESSSPRKFLTDQGREVLVLAEIYASFEGSLLIERRHLLLALIGLKQDVFMRVLSIENNRIDNLVNAHDPAGVALLVEGNASLTTYPSRSLQLSEMAEFVLIYARLESLEANDANVGWKNLLLGLLRAELSTAELQLRPFGVDYLRAKRFFEEHSESTRLEHPVTFPMHQL